MRSTVILGMIACLSIGARCDSEDAKSDAQVCPEGWSAAQCAGSVRDGAIAQNDEDAGTRVPNDAGPSAPKDAGPPEPAPIPEEPEAPPPAADAPLDCKAIDHALVPQGLELFATFGGVSVLAADAQRVYGMRFGEAWEEIWSLDDAANTAEVVADHLDTVQVVVPAAGEVFFNSASSGNEVVVSKVVIGTGEVVNLARENYANVNALAVDGDHVYWLANGTTVGGTTALFASDRQSDNTVALAIISGAGGVHRSLVKLGDALYFAVYGSDGIRAQLYRFALGGENAMAQPLGTPQGIAGLVSDGEHLFAALGGTRDRLGNATGLRGVARVDITDGSFQLLFPDLQQPAEMLAVDGSRIYWLSPSEQRIGQLSAGNKDGSGEPNTVAHGWGPGGTGLVQNPSGVYWTIACGSKHHVMRAMR